jgi:hypothetical protein
VKGGYDGRVDAVLEIDLDPGYVMAVIGIPIVRQSLSRVRPVVIMCRCCCYAVVVVAVVTATAAVLRCRLVAGDDGWC